MPTTIPEPYADLRSRDSKAFAFFAAARTDGRSRSPRSGLTGDGTNLRINTALRWPRAYLHWARMAVTVYHGLAYSRGKLGAILE